MEAYNVLITINLLAVIVGTGVWILVGANYLTKWSTGNLVLRPGKERLSAIFMSGLFIFLLIFAYTLTKENKLSSGYKMTYSGILTVANIVLATIMLLFYNRRFRHSQLKTAKKEFKDLFQGDSFGKVNERLIELGIVDQHGKWLGGPLKRKRDISVLMSILIVNGVLITDDYKEENKLATRYFQTNFDYVEMTALIKNYSDYKPEKKDVQSYKLLDFINNIQC